MIFYGTYVFNKIMGYFGEIHECENCHNKYKSRILRTRKWMHIMFVPLIPFGTSYTKVCPICFKTEKIKKKEARELMQMPDMDGQNIDTLFIHHTNANNKEGYEIWVVDNKTNQKTCVLKDLNVYQLRNFKKNMGYKDAPVKEVE